jgi:succinoglycan biosynthesis transport protein ExoP
MQAVSSGRPGVAQAIDELDLGALGRALWRKKIWVLGLTLLAAVIATLIVNLITPRYKSEARVLVEQRENIFLRPDAEKSLERGVTVDQEAITSQVQLILSRDLALDVIKKLKLGEKPEFDPVLRGMSLPKVILVQLGFLKDPMEQTPDERVLKSFYDRLTAFQVEKSRVIAIEFESEDPKLAAEAANAIAEGYLVLQQTAKQGQSRSAGLWLSGEIENLRRKVADAESKVEQYRARSNLLVGTNNTTLSNQQLGDINAQLASARALKSDAEAKARIIREALKTGAAVEFSDIVNSELMRRLSEQRVTLQAQLAEQSSTLLGQHPRIKELRAQITDLERQLRVEADRLARSFENDAKMADARVQGLSASLDQLKSAAATTNEQDVQLRALEREAKSQRDLLESYLAKYREASARDNIGAASPEARIISSAIVSNTPSYPKKIPTILIASLGMFVLSSGFVLSGELLGAMSTRPMPRTIPESAPEPVRERQEIPVRQARPVSEPVMHEPLANKAMLAPVRPLDVAPAAASPPPAPIVSAPLVAPVAPPRPAPAMAEIKDAPALAPEPLAHEPPAEPKSVESKPLDPNPIWPEFRLSAGVPNEAIDSLARDLAAAGPDARRITVVGTRRNIGTTRAAVSLARRLASRGKVALIDLALNAPNLSAIAADPGTPGLSELVAGTASFGQIITRDRLSRLHIITAGKVTDPNAVLGSPRLAITIEALARSYDHVVLDAGALPEAEIQRLARLTPKAVLVGEAIDPDATAAGREQLIQAGFRGISVLTCAPGGPELDTAKTSAAA